MKDKLLIRMIPLYPKSCSLMHLAIRAGYIKRPFSDKKIERGRKNLLRRLNWLTLKCKGLTQQVAPLQLTTKIFLEKAGCPYDQQINEIYFSFIKE